jgi:hypothetical protein
VHRNFKEALTIKTPFAAEAIYGGQLLGVRGQDFVCFYDWATGKVRFSCFLPGLEGMHACGQATAGWLYMAVVPTAAFQYSRCHHPTPHSVLPAPPCICISRPACHRADLPARPPACSSLLQVVRRIDVAAKGVHWSEGGNLVAIAADASFYLLEYNRDLAESYLASGQVRLGELWLWGDICGVCLGGSCGVTWQVSDGGAGGPRDCSPPCTCPQQ